MSKERHRRATDLFLEARELSGAERKALLDRACAGDDELRALVEGMLGVDEATVSFLNPARADVEPGAAPMPGDVALLNPGDRVGHYVIREKLGEGGFAVVYAAEQEQPVRRKVALKIIKLGMDTNQVIARFEAERQALAMMDHVNVARVFDAGATDTGRPYFVMEFVAGTPITDHCDRHRLTVDQRLALFRQACDAVQHAHQKGIIHRDIKPSNVLVAMKDGAAQVKVIDFGVAKAITQRLTEKTIYTEQGQLIGTPEYMSPEQAEMTAENIDTRSDIYSLGVLLYELLTGSLPFDPTTLRKAAFAEIQRIIREVEPPKPSTRLSSLGDESAANAQQRRLDPKALYRELHGDLDWIVMKALEKDRSRRYETASGLADDLRRHLAHEPVVARPPSAAYRLSRFVRRNRAGVAAVSVVALSLIAAAVVSVVFAVSEAEQRRLAEDARDDADEKAAELETVVDFQAAMLSDLNAYAMGESFVDNLRQSAESKLLETGLESAQTAELLAAFDRAIGAVNPTNLALKTLDEHLLARAADTIESSFADQPLTEASLRQTLANTYTGLRLPGALPHQERALEIRRDVLGADHPDTLTSMLQMGRLLYYTGGPEERTGATAAKPYFLEALEGRRRVLGDGHPDTRDAMIEWAGGGYAPFTVEAESSYRDAVAGFRRALGNDDPRTLNSINTLAHHLHLAGHWAGQSGDLTTKARKLAEAEPFCIEAMEGRRRVLGDEHPDTLESIDRMGNLLQSQGKLNEAEPYHREALAGQRRVLGDQHDETLRTIMNMGSRLLRQNKLDEAEPYFREAVAGYRRMLHPRHPSLTMTIHGLGTLLQRQGKLKEAEPFLREALEVYSSFGEDHGGALVLMNDYGWLLYNMGREDEAAELYLTALERCRAVLGEEHATTRQSLNNIGWLRLTQGRLTEAEKYLLESMEVRRRVFGDEHPETLHAVRIMAQLREAQGKLTEAGTLYSEIVDVVRRTRPDDVRGLTGALVALGINYIKQNRFAEAEPYLTECLDIRRRVMPEGHWLIWNTQSLLGETLTGQGRFDDAEKMLVQAAEQIEPPQQLRNRTDEAIERVVDLYDAWHEAQPDGGYAVKAAEWRAKLPAEPDPDASALPGDEKQDE